MIRFYREEVIVKPYSMSLSKFMKWYYAGARICHENHNIVAIYVDSKLNSGNMTHVFNVPIIEDLDLEDDQHVKKKMIKAHFKNQIDPLNFKL